MGGRGGGADNQMHWGVEWGGGVRETVNFPLEVLKQRSYCSNSLASSLNVRPKWSICLPSELPRLLLCFSFFFFQLWGKSMFFCGVCITGTWPQSLTFCGNINPVKTGCQGNRFSSEMRWERLLKKRESISFCRRKTPPLLNLAPSFLVFHIFFALIIKNVWHHWTTASYTLLVSTFLPDYRFTPNQAKSRGQILFSSVHGTQVPTAGLYQERHIHCVSFLQ